MSLFSLEKYSTFGTIVGQDAQWWFIQEDDGRRVHVRVNQFSGAVDLHVGDRVEVQPVFQSGLAWRPYGWTIVRKLEGAQSQDMRRV
jgi:hypothetical protein